MPRRKLLPASEAPASEKTALIAQIIASLRREMDACERGARAAHAEAIDEQSKAENKYDTRGLEASYLARGQSRQMAEIAEALRAYESFPVREFTHGEAIDLGAIVELVSERMRALYFVGPHAGGTEIALLDEVVLVITPQSPLGKSLLERRKGDRLKISLGGAMQELHIADVR